MDLLRTPRGYLSTLGRTARIEEIITVLRSGQRQETLFSTGNTLFFLSGKVLRRTGALIQEEAFELDKYGFLILAGGPGQTFPVEGEEPVTVWEYVTTATGTTLLGLLNLHRS